MKQFNPEKELNKIQYGDRNKLIGIIVFLLVIIAVGSTYALYQIRHTNKLVFNTVSEFKKRDIYLSVLIDGETKPEFPGKEDGYVFDNIICDKPGIEASFNNDTWKLTLTTGTTNKCTVKFITKPYMDGSGANYPDLFQGLIPIRFDENNKMYIADYKEKWYDYNNHEWANAVLIDHNNLEVIEKFYTDGELNVNTEITTDDVLQMYVWIPRYKYELWNAVSGQSSNPQMINIKFENTIETTGEVSCSTASNGKETCINDENGNWYTHPAFTFGDTQLRGIWVGKFEPSDPTDPIGRTVNKINEITILPDKTSMTFKNILTLYNAERNIEKENNKYNLNSIEIDTHPMKNIEWGAVAYLTSSKYGRYKEDGSPIESGTRIWINNTAQGTNQEQHGGTYTGCVGESANAQVIWNNETDTPAKCDADKVWTKSGVKASTTGNIYGIYDMSGGVWEYTMGIISNQAKTEPYYSASGLSKTTMPNTKYYNLYEFGESMVNHARGHLGDATRETLSKFGRTPGAWDDGNSEFPFVTTTLDSWLLRGDIYINNNNSGVFSFSRLNGVSSRSVSFRSVLTAQDGNE